MKHSAIITAISLALVFAMFLSLCGCKSDVLSDVSGAVGVDVTSGKLDVKKDTHGGIRGSGATYYKISFQTDDCLNEIRQSSEWTPLPLTENLKRCLSMHRILWENLPVPEITNGYYCFVDRHTGATDRKDDSELHDRAFYNYTLAIYDADTNTMFYLKVDS